MSLLHCFSKAPSGVDEVNPPLTLLTMQGKKENIVSSDPIQER
jgi:hypothetical protein